MSNEHPTLHLWCVKTCRNYEPDKGTIMNEYVTATCVEQVWEYTALDRGDAGVEVLGIHQEVPILKELHNTKKDRRDGNKT